MRTSLIAAFSISILWEFAKQGFVFYLANAGGWGRVYGFVGVFVIFLLWVYYSALVFVIGGD